MKNTETIVNDYINKNLEKEFDRIQAYAYNELKLIPSEDSCKNEWMSLFNTNKSWSFSNIIKRFHQSICLANRRNMLCPFDGWGKIKSDKILFEKLLRNRLTYNESFIKHGIPNEIPLHIYAQGMSIMRLYPEVSYFKPSLAKYLINKYLNDTEWILDPFSGYSGRMLGALACNKNYCGSDLCYISTQESEQIYNWLLNNFDNIQQVYIDNTDAEELHSDTFDALFTCPPYEDIESWPDVQSTIHTCDDWIDICIKNNKCKKYLFVVDNKIEKWKSNIVETLENKSHFGKNIEYVVLI